MVDALVLVKTRQKGDVLLGKKCCVCLFGE